MCKLDGCEGGEDVRDRGLDREGRCVAGGGGLNRLGGEEVCEGGGFNRLGRDGGRDGGLDREEVREGGEGGCGLNRLGGEEGRDGGLDREEVREGGGLDRSGGVFLRISFAIDDISCVSCSSLSISVAIDDSFCSRLFICGSVLALVFTSSWTLFSTYTDCL